MKHKKGQGKELEQKKGHQGENDWDRNRTTDVRIPPIKAGMGHTSNSLYSG